MALPNLKRVSNTAFAGLTALGLAFSPIASAPASAQQLQTVATPATGTPAPTMSQRDALGLSKGKIVLFYGEGIQDVDLAAAALTRRGYPALVIAGGPAGKVRIMVNGKFCGSGDQNEVYNGSLPGGAADCYDDEKAQGRIVGTPGPYASLAP